VHRHLLERGNGKATVHARSPLWVTAFTFLLLAGITIPSLGAGGATSTVRRPSTYDDQLTQYRAFRRMHARSEKFNHEGWLDAWTELDARGFRYEIVSERGSEYVRNKVLKAVLKREQELVAEGPERAALNGDNYIFSEASEAVDGLRYVTLTPRRKDIVLIEGRMVLSPDGSDLLRVEGRLAKNPSFWTSRVNVTRHFAKIEGVRVPVSTESIAKVKFAGHSRLDVSYEYESINGRPVTLAGRHTSAPAIATAGR
jgi:hypothetical protein